MFDYRPLWVTLARQGMTKTQLKERATISSNILASMGKSQAVSMSAIWRICESLKVPISDVVAMVYDDTVPLYLTADSPIEAAKAWVEDHLTPMPTRTINYSVSDVVIRQWVKRVTGHVIDREELLTVMSELKFNSASTLPNGKGVWNFNIDPGDWRMVRRKFSEKE